MITRSWPGSSSWCAEQHKQYDDKQYDDKQYRHKRYHGITTYNNNLSETS